MAAKPCRIRAPLHPRGASPGAAYRANGASIPFSRAPREPRRLSGHRVSPRASGALRALSLVCENQQRYSSELQTQMGYSLRGHQIPKKGSAQIKTRRKAPASVVLLGLALVATLTGCDGTIPEDVVEVLAGEYVPRSISRVTPWQAEVYNKTDHCARERQFPLDERSWVFPWMSPCLNFRPIKAGTFTALEDRQEFLRLKAEWEAKHGETQPLLLGSWEERVEWYENTDHCAMEAALPAKARPVPWMSYCLNPDAGLFSAGRMTPQEIHLKMQRLKAEWEDENGVWKGYDKSLENAGHSHS